MNNKAKLYLVGVVIATVFAVTGCSAIRDAVGRAVTQMDNNWFARTHYRTTDIADYGKYVGNFDNKFAKEVISAFFPAKIEDSFTDVRYVYSAVKVDSAAFEAYLEFVIEDPEAFSAYIQQVTNDDNIHPFHYDDSYMEYTISNLLTLGDERTFESDFADYKAGTDFYRIQVAKIQKILYSPAEQRIIYVAIGVYDGGGTGTYFLSTFFDRFGIDPKEYEEHLQEESEATP